MHRPEAEPGAREEGFQTRDRRPVPDMCCDEVFVNSA